MEALEIDDPLKYVRVALAEESKFGWMLWMMIVFGNEEKSGFWI